jgi:hypothetical protein
MNRRLNSEGKQPGMQANRHCADCGALLPPDGHERCIECRPALSHQARAVGAVRRQEREQIEKAERQITSLQSLIRKMYRRLS